MNMQNLRLAVDACQAGGVIAYPTESVFGLGCLPENEQAVDKILELKQRSVSKGLICVAANRQQLEELVDFSAIPDIKPLEQSWPGPYTWLVPALDSTPRWLTGEHATLAVRVSAYPVVQHLCRELGPLVSTSANRHGMLPARNTSQVKAYFANELDYIYPAELPDDNKPTEIRDAISGKVLRIS